MTFGNNDGDILLLTRIAAKYPHVTLSAPFGQAEADGRRLAFVHHPEFGEGLAALGRYDAGLWGTPTDRSCSGWGTRSGQPRRSDGALAGRYGIYDTETGAFKHVDTLIAWPRFRTGVESKGRIHQIQRCGGDLAPTIGRFLQGLHKLHMKYLETLALSAVVFFKCGKQAALSLGGGITIR